MEKNYFKNKNILITGITGFIGSHLAKKLESLDAKVFGVSRSSEGKHIFKANITDFSIIDQVIKTNNINICYHLAAESLVESGKIDPYHTFKFNTLGALNILESARKNKLERVVIASTSHVYGENKPPFKETYQPKPSRPYETSKTCTDILAQSYADTFNLPILISRCINTYGPGDLNLNRLIPKTINSILHDQSPTMWGGGGIIRDYLYIDDVVNAYLCLGKTNIEKVGKNRIFNFGSGNIVSVKDLMERLINISGKNMKIKKIEDGRDDEIKAQYVSWKKAKRLLNWQPKISLDDGLKKTLKWYENYFHNRNSDN